MLTFYRMGNYYEAFGADAVIAANTVGLTLNTARGKGREQAGFPVFWLDRYVDKLKSAGHEVTVIEEAAPRV